MIRILAVYFVPRRREVTLHRMKAIMLTLSRCQQFYAKQVALALNWRLHPTPVLGSHETAKYNDDLCLVGEAREKTRCTVDTLGIFFDGHLSRSAFATIGDGGPEFFVIAQPHLTHMERGRHSEVVTHEIGHTLGLDDRRDGLSIMRKDGGIANLAEPGLFPWTRAHLARDDREYLRKRWGHIEPN